ncbi:3-oxoadipate--succinyl-CoA transferase subunit A [Mangrovactinospora gilvigrisea]|uniref:3-oxoadipate--succinyl-CoA transferase subunit A n=1 Tax=Mangrovactinospora gilvigrisea TaxID=1428644 RepID=A0A1J7CD56_9ACTN|nr:CoA-transferase [Mangrovactinospora gilvigrisea]OIV37602.1 3-oxoadipate--succinyl-CoA transferase subunit A [Mangrovactinospora gilvigrisea]
MDKTTTMSEAIARYVADGATVALEGFTHLIPTAAGHEIIRQRRRGLTVVRMTPDIVTDQMIAADCVAKVVGAFVGNSSAGSLGELRRRVEAGTLELEECSHYGMICRYLAGAQRLPFYPLRSYAGSDLPRVNPGLRKVVSPYPGPDGGEPEQVYVVPPVHPDVTIIHAQRADRRGNVQIWGLTGIQAEAVYAARHAVAVVEEVVDDAVVRADPNRTAVPAHAIDAVVACPHGAHPSFAQGYYDRDNAFYRRWAGISKDPERLKAWLEEYVLGTRDHAEYVAKLAADGTWDRLAVGSAPSGSIDYGRRLRKEHP